MSMISNPCVQVQTTPQEQPSVPEWFAEVVIVAQVLRSAGVLDHLQQEVRLVRGRMGTYEPMDFLAVLLGYAISGERTLERFYERLTPYADAFMALFGRCSLPHRCTLSRFLAAVDASCLQSVRALFEQESFAAGWTAEMLGGLFDRQGQRHLVFDVDGTRQVARQRGLPTDVSLPQAQRRFSQVCAPGYRGRKRGEVVRTRTTILQMQTHQCVGTFGGAGNGDYQGELHAAILAITAYLACFDLPLSLALVRLDGLYGDGVIAATLIEAGIPFVTRWSSYQLLSHPQIQEVLQQEPTACLSSPSGMPLELFEGGWLPIGAGGLAARFIVLRHRLASGHTAAAVGHLQGQWVYELFACTLAAPALLVQDVVDLYHGRGAFEAVLAEEDQEGDPDRWCSHTACGQELWQVIWQWVWNLRLSLGQQMSEQGLRQMEWAPEQPAPAQLVPAPECARVYGPWQWAGNAGAGRSHLPARAFVLLEDGQAQCPAGARLCPQPAIRQETAVSQRRIYVASHDACAPCGLREACLGVGAAAHQVRHISAVRHLQPAACTLVPQQGQVPAIRWIDVAARAARRCWRTHWQGQQVTILELSCSPQSCVVPPRPDRAGRSHQRLSWSERLARNAWWGPPRLRITVAGVPAFLSA